MEIFMAILGRLADFSWFLLIPVVYYFVGIRFIPNSKVGIVEIIWSTKGSLNENIIALNGEAGFQPNVVRGGIHIFPRPFYRLHLVPLVNIPQGEIGYIFARDGSSLDPSQTLGKIIPESNNFQNVTNFLTNGGQKGPQRGVIREGTYAFNLAQFIVLTAGKNYSLSLDLPNEEKLLEEMNKKISSRQGFKPVIIGDNDDYNSRGYSNNSDNLNGVIGIVTVHDGPTLSPGEIIAPTVGTDETEYKHNSFQDPEIFLKVGGRRGRQYEVLVEGTYFINRLFATVEIIPKTLVPVGNVGVVNSYIGGKGEDLSGESYRHGELVEVGNRGVWKVGLVPGKYAWNKFAGEVIIVPTTNFILKWIGDEKGEHGYDSNLAEVRLITKDAFEPSLPLAVSVHISTEAASKVIQRFGDIQKLVDQTLDPMIGAYFKNISQCRTLIDLLQQRDEIQKLAGQEMKIKFAEYDIDLIEVLIGTPTDSKQDNRIETLLSQLRDRQIAEEQQKTYLIQENAAKTKRSLVEAEETASMQKELTQSKINVEIVNNEGAAKLKTAEQNAAITKTAAEAQALQTTIIAEAEGKKIKIMAAAKANETTLTGNAEAEVILAKGQSEAKAIDLKVNAFKNPANLVSIENVKQISGAIGNYTGSLVPNTFISTGGNGEGGNQNLIQSLLINNMVSGGINPLNVKKAEDEVSQNNEVKSETKVETAEKTYELGDTTPEVEKVDLVEEENK